MPQYEILARFWYEPKDSLGKLKAAECKDFRLSDSEFDSVREAAGINIGWLLKVGAIKLKPVGTGL